MTRVSDRGDGATLNQEAQRETLIPDYDITWTANEPTAGSSATIADGIVPTSIEIGQSIADLTAKMNLILALVKAQGLMKSS